MTTVRAATEVDVDGIWRLMRELAVFERYIDEFAVTPEVVRECGFRKQPPDFHCLVAEQADAIVGIAVYYFLPYTAQNRPDVYLKELYVNEASRGQGIGSRLMGALCNAAQAAGCGNVKWTVAPWNEAGVRFYKMLGARENRDWLDFELQL